MVRSPVAVRAPLPPSELIVPPAVRFNVPLMLTPVVVAVRALVRVYSPAVTVRLPPLKVPMVELAPEAL